MYWENSALGVSIRLVQTSGILSLVYHSKICLLFSIPPYAAGRSASMSLDRVSNMAAFLREEGGMGRRAASAPLSFHHCWV